MRVHVFQHVPFEGLGEIEPWLSEHRHEITRTRFFHNDPLPALDKVDWLIVMGGPMNVYEHRNHSWLPYEKRFIERAIGGGKGVLGICLGAQLIADVLGAKVYQNPEKEIGWLPVIPHPEAAPWLGKPESSLKVFHWHGDTFDLPAGAQRLAESEGCRNQAFAYGTAVIGLQFHLEMNRTGAAKLLEHGRDDLTPGRFVQTEEEILRGRSPAAHHALHHLLNVMAKITPVEG